MREVLRDTMYAATVTGSPVENACRLIKRYEAEGRGYYGAALALFGREPDGQPVVDSPILIRTADVDLEGRLKVTAGATLVRDSDAAYEVAETHAKAGGILSAFGLVPAAPVPEVDLAELAADEDVLIALGARNARLSTFWLTDQAGAPPDPRLKGQRVLVLDGEDDFVNMLRHVLGVLGLESEVVRHEAIDDRVLDSLATYDLVIVGPGPGDPRDGDDPKMQRIRAAVDRLLENRRPFLAVCLGHQTLCHRLGIGLHFKDIVFQGTQSPVEIDGRVSASAPTTPSSAGSRQAGQRRRTSDERHRRGRPGLRRHPRADRAALQGHPVPRRVDPDPARLRPGPRDPPRLLGETT